MEIESFQLTEGEEARLYAVTEPSDVPAAEVIWGENEFVQVVESDHQSALYRAVKTTNGAIKTASVKAKALEGDYVTQNVSFEILRFIPALETLTVQANKSLDDLGYKEKVQLTASPTPLDAEYDAVTWSTSDFEVANVNPSTGEVTVNNGGVAVITATSGDVKGQIEIRSKHYALTGFTVTDSIGSAGPYNLTVGDQVRLFATQKPVQAEFENIRWGSNEFIRLVSDDGVSALYEAVKATTSETAIAVQAASVHQYYTGAAIRFNVSEFVPEPEPIPELVAIDLELSREISSIEYMGQAQMIATPVPERAEFRSKFTWATDNPNVVDISPSGVITVKNAGNARITATCGTVTKTIILTSNYYAVEGVTVASEAGATGTHEVEPGAQIKFVATSTPSQAVVSYQWSSNQYVTLVSQTGNTAIYEATEVTEKATTGDVTTVSVTATGAYGGTASANITIKVPKVK